MEYTYDKLDRERTISHPVRKQTNAFDKLGNLLQFNVKDALGEQDSHFSYDNLNQLTSEKGQEEHKYQYDSLYNRIQKDKTDCDISPLNHLLNQEGIEYKYDANGNLIEKNERGTITKYTYDAWNRLTKSCRGNQETQYTYDAFHRRLSKNQELYLYDGQDEIACYEKGQIQALRVLGVCKEAEIGGAIAYEIDGKTLIPLHDHNGNVVSLLHSDGTAFKTYHYTAFGIELDDSVTDKNPWRFCSKHFDPETGFVYFGRRYYDPEMARWSTPDPTDYEDGPNLHAYLRNNPLCHLDPYGLWSMPSWNSIGNSLFNLAAQASAFLGNALYTIGHELMPCPLLKDIFQFPGHLLCGNSPSSYVMSYREQHSYYEMVGQGSEGFSSNTICVNGFGVSADEARQRALNTYNSTGGKYDTYASYNADHGFVSNVLESAAQLLGIPVHASQVLRECVTLASFTRGEDGRTFINTHSQGGLTLYDAGRTLPQKVTSGVDAFTIGSPVALSDKMFGSAKNMTANSDFVSWGARMYNGIKSGLGGNPAPINVMRTKGSVLKAHGYDKPTYKAVVNKRLQYIKHN